MHQAISLSEVKMAWGLVRHQRKQPRPNGFAVKACFVRLRFKQGDAKVAFSEKCAGLTIDRGGLFSVQAKDYGLEAHNLKFPEFLPNFKKTIEEASNTLLDGDVVLQTFPRMLGFAFNPVNFWFFHRADGVCPVIACEVNNTFGERHFYLLQAAQAGPIDQGALLSCQKAFHVSPFFPVSGRYEFRFMNQGDRTLARINYFENNEMRLSTSVSGEMRTPTRKLWFLTVCKYGWFTAMVVLKIHWQALKLWRKGATFHPKPDVPKNKISHTQTEA